MYFFITILLQGKESESKMLQQGEGNTSIEMIKERMKQKRRKKALNDSNTSWSRSRSKKKGLSLTLPGNNHWCSLNYKAVKKHLTLLLITQLKTIVSIKNLLGHEQWRAVQSIKHCEKQLPLK